MEDEERGRGTRTWRFFMSAAESIVDRCMERVEGSETAFYLRHSYKYQLVRYDEDGKVRTMLWEMYCGTSELLSNILSARAFLTEMEEIRLDPENIERPNTQWTFARWVMTTVTAIVTNQPLLGEGRLHDWLRHKKGLYALDTFADTVCVFRCIALHRGARPDRRTTPAKLLARQYF